MRSYPDGSSVLVDIESEGPAWLEWCAALYESYATDHDGEMSDSYARTAHRLAEEIEYASYVDFRF